MFETLSGKIEYEYNKFYEEKKRQSKENIFASSYEIEAKKEIRRMLTKGLGYQEEIILLHVPNLLDQVYLLMEADKMFGEESVMECVHRLIRS